MAATIYEEEGGGLLAVRIGAHLLIEGGERSDDSAPKLIERLGNGLEKRRPMDPHHVSAPNGAEANGGLWAYQRLPGRRGD